MKTIGYIIGLLLLGGAGFWIYSVLKKAKKKWIERPEKGKVKDILERTKQTGKEQREALSKMKQSDLEHELNKSFRNLQRRKK